MKITVRPPLGTVDRRALDNYIYSGPDPGTLGGNSNSGTVAQRSWCHRRDGTMEIQVSVGQRVTWIPNEVGGWDQEDEWDNPFSRLLGRPLTEDEMDLYTEWSEPNEPRQGIVIQVSDNSFTIRLVDESRFGQLSECQYPSGTDLGEYWARVRESPDYVHSTQ